MQRRRENRSGLQHCVVRFANEHQVSEIYFSKLNKDVNPFFQYLGRNLEKNADLFFFSGSIRFYFPLISIQV
jgi:hypothetical protein